jgi:hypothetical protein
MTSLPFFLGLLLPQAEALPPDSALVHTDGRIPPAITAVRVNRPPRIDGVLDDDVWNSATPVSGFRRDSPNDGASAAERTEVRIVFDDRALYVGARLRDSQPEAISRRLDRRDTFEGFNDEFFVLLDSYHDHRTSFIFGVTPAGGRNDGIATGDSREHIDASWDPVWEARTSIDSEGWVAEMRIPFSQLRFSSAKDQTWGILLFRDIFRAGEAVDWPWTSQAEAGFASQFGHLLGLTDIPTQRRLEVLPYAVTQGTFTEGADPANPFNSGTTGHYAGGADIKYGISSDFTLDVTLNPDFGQVDADPAVVNLSVLETQFPELRPFFIEGSSIFRFGVGGHQLFYSRRIGKAPSRSMEGSVAYVDEPVAATIIGAAKLSGRTQSGWSIGVLDAVTANEYAQMADVDGTPLPDEPIEPLTNFGIVRAQKDFGDGSSQVGAFASTVHRDISDPSLNFLNRSAYSGGVDFLHRFQRNAYSVSGILAFSHIRGDPAALDRVQRSSARYFQRPDQDHLTYDPTRTSLTGALGLVSFRENNGNWTFNVGGGGSHPGFEINDAGIQFKVDNIVGFGGVARRWLQPGKVFRSARVGTDLSASMNFGGTVMRKSVTTRFNGQLHSFWNVGGSIVVQSNGLSDRATRGGPLMETPALWDFAASVGSDTRNTVSFRAGLGTMRRREGTWSVEVLPSINVRSGALGFSLASSYSRSHADAFYVTQSADPLATATYGGRYVFGQLDRSTLDITLRVDWALSRNLTLQFYGQPLVDAGNYERYKEFTTPSGYAFLEYGVDGASTVSYDDVNDRFTVDADGPGPGAAITFSNPDFKVRSLRTNLVFRWEYRPGSTLFLAWSQNSFFAGPDPSFQPVRELGDIPGDDQQNVLLVKINYWLSY